MNMLPAKNTKFGNLVPSDKPYRVYLKLDGRQIFDSDGKPAWIDVFPEDSAIGRRFDRAQRDEALALARAGTEQPTQIEINAAKCAALTAAWYLVDPETLEAIDVPCTLENANDLYSRPGCQWIWAPVWLAANNHVNFIRRSSPSSSTMPSGISETGDG